MSEGDSNFGTLVLVMWHVKLYCYTVRGKSLLYKSAGKLPGSM